MRDDDVLSEAEATRLWQRAAQLQAEEARRAEARAVSEAAGELEAGISRRQEGYALTHVRAAAVEAGIGSEFVDAALAEVEAERALRGGSAPKRRISRWLLGSPTRTLTCRRTIAATPEQVLAAMEEVLPEAPYELLLRERIGNPLEGGTVAFDIQGVGFTTGSLPGFRGDASYADLRKVFVTVSPLPGEPPRTEMTVRAPVDWAYGVNAAVTGGLAVLGGGLVLLLTGAVATSVAGLGPVALGLLVATGGGAGGAATLGGMRAVYRYGLRRGERALDGLLSQVAAKAEGGWGLSTGADTKRLPGE